jgi:cobalt-precorrin 5A hydrolase
MKIAIITITEDAKKLAMNIAEKLDKDPTIITVDIFHKNVKEELKKNFGKYNCILGIMATGIMIRSVCSLIKNKIEDPAVLVMDDQGKHIISLLSGHFGGANEMAFKISEVSGSEPVITTATDVHGKIGIDSISRKYYFHLEDYKNINAINSALIRNKRVDLYIPKEYDFIFKDNNIINSYNQKRSKNNNLIAVYGKKSIILKPKRLVLGIGSRKGITKIKVYNAINNAIKVLDLPHERINSIATGVMKKNERGIVQVAKELNLPFKTFTIEQIKHFNHVDCSSSSFVENKFGISGVCEPAALIAAGKDSCLIFKKTAYNGVTIALAVSRD